VKLVLELNDDFLCFGGLALDKFVKLMFELFIVVFPLLKLRVEGSGELFLFMEGVGKLLSFTVSLSLNLELFFKMLIFLIKTLTVSFKLIILTLNGF
jgi:hypothetical protein